MRGTDRVRGYIPILIRPGRRIEVAREREYGVGMKP